MTTKQKTDLQRLTDLVARLRAPDGCPWDREQTAPDLRAYLLEEAHEVAAAIDEDDWQGLAAELGDLLFQIVFLAALAAEAGQFDVADVIDRIEAKMISRHPHVFGDERAASADEVRRSWERRKLEDAGRDGSLLDGVAPSVPALLAAYRLTQKAAGVGFDWPSPDGVRRALAAELDELDGALARDDRHASVRDEVGDVLFTAANLARHLGIDPEAALARANNKFRRRFAAVEEKLTQRGRRLADASLEELDRLWRQVKLEERSAEARDGG